MANAGNKRWSAKSYLKQAVNDARDLTHVQYRLIKDNKRQLPCHPVIKVRIKVILPGVQTRWCELCQEWRYFTLRGLAGPTPPAGPGRNETLLRLHWMTEQETADHKAGVDLIEWDGNVTIHPNP